MNDWFYSGAARSVWRPPPRSIALWRRRQHNESVDLNSWLAPDDVSSGHWFSFADGVNYVSCRLVFLSGSTDWQLASWWECDCAIWFGAYSARRRQPFLLPMAVCVLADGAAGFTAEMALEMDFVWLRDA